MCHREKKAQGIPILDKLTDFNPMNDSQSSQTRSLILLYPLQLGVTGWGIFLVNVAMF